MSQLINNSSVSSPTAHNTKLCAVGSVYDAEFLRILGLADKMKCTNYVYYVIIYLQLFGGLRITEVLNIQCQHITSLGFVNVRGIKGSNNKFVNVPEVKDFLRNCKLSSIDPFYGISRFMVYRFYKKHSISHLFSNSYNSSVTHYLRHLYAIQVNSTADNINDVRDTMGHKSVNSTKHYIHTK